MLVLLLVNEKQLRFKVPRVIFSQILATKVFLYNRNITHNWYICKKEFLVYEVLCSICNT